MLYRNHNDDNNTQYMNQNGSTGDSDTTLVVTVRLCCERGEGPGYCGKLVHIHCPGMLGLLQDDRGRGHILRCRIVMSQCKPMQKPSLIPARMYLAYALSG